MPPKKTDKKAEGAAAAQTALQTANRQAPPRPKGDDMGTDRMRHKQKRWLEKSKKPAREGVRAKTAQAAKKVLPKAARLAGPAATVGSALGGPSQSQRQTSKQVRSFEKKNPGFTVTKTKDGFRTTRKPTEAGIARQDRYRKAGKAKRVL